MAESEYLGHNGTISFPYYGVTDRNGGHSVNPIHNGSWSANILYIDGHVVELRSKAPGPVGRPFYYNADMLKNKYYDDNPWTINGEAAP